MMEQDELRKSYHRHHHSDDNADNGSRRWFLLRQCLNAAFLILSVAGITLWYTYSRDIGIYTLIAATAFKFAELSMRIMNL
jgi:hypothetical protein